MVSGKKQGTEHKPGRADSWAEFQKVRAARLETCIQQAGNNKHEDICISLELFAREVMPEFKAVEAEREARKQEELAPYIEAALARKKFMSALADQDIPEFVALGRKITEESKAKKESIYERPAAG